MDVIKPKTLCIGTRCYRLNTSSEVNNGSSSLMFNYENVDDAGYEDEEFEVVELKDGRYSISFPVPSQFFSQIIGSKGATRRRIEQETKVQIVIPKQGQEGDIKITSTSKKNVLAARRRIELIVLSGRGKLPFTHFLSIPVTTNDIQTSFIKFKEQVLAIKPYGIKDSFFQNPQKLHLTICTLTLLDNNDRATASQTLQDCKELFSSYLEDQKSEIMVDIKGVEIMNDDPSAAHVLYGKVAGFEEVQILMNKLNKAFETKGLFGGLQHQKEFVKLHVTLINSLFGVSDDEKGDRETFDASVIVENFKEFYFGKHLIKEIHLSQRYTTGSNGYYEASSILKL